ncbi:MAG TPA: ATP-binding protein [Anaeromyxobacteraceae bacterium]|nr:ATP-binding protein [Anaeromyxobacteraceae bacterium]
MSGIAHEGGGLALRRRVYLLIGTATFFPLLVMGAAGWTWLQALDERLLGGRLAAASGMAAHFESELSGDLENLQRLASGLGAGIEDANLEPERRAFREVAHYLRHRERLFLLSRDGRPLVEEPSGGQPAGEPAPDPLLEDVLATGRPRISGIEVGPRGKSVRELVPVRRYDGAIVAVAGGSFDPGRRDFARMLAHLRRGETGVAEIVDADGRVVASTVPGRAGQVSACAKRTREDIRSRRAYTQRCLTCHLRSEVPVPEADELLTMAPLTSIPWAVVVRQSVDEALPTQGAVSWRMVLLVLLAQAALTGAFAWGAARSVTQPVAVLTREAERIAGGDLTAAIPDLGGDEVGRLGGSLERMRSSLREMVDHVERVNEDLERRVEERTRELEEANRQLKEREIARGEVLRKVIGAQEEERKRIARELHDETTQSLAVLLMGLEAAGEALRAGKVPHLDEVKAVAVRTLEDVHRLILDLRPAILDDLGLLSAIRWYAERALESRGISVRCEFGEMDRRLPPEMETALFRMCQEAMSNVARHAHASAVLIQVGNEGDAVRIEIEDDGTGFDLEAVKQREGRRPWGLLGIRERADILGGTATIESAPGQGTRVLVHIPLPVE